MGSDFLFAMPSFMSGAARCLDLGATFDGYNESPTPEMADARALFADWHEVGTDLVDAMERFRANEPEATQLVLALGER
jgi:hypothetical protein